MANNNGIFNGALTGTTSGVASRWITSTNAADYNAQRTLIAAFATEVDSAIPAGVFGQGSVDLMESICNSFWKDRYLTEDADLEMAAGAIVALFTSVNTEVLPDGGGGASSEPWSGTFFADTGTAIDPGDQNGSPTLPFAEAQQAADVCVDGNTVVVGPGNSIGDVTVESKNICWYGLTAQAQTFTNFQCLIGSYTFTDATQANKITSFINFTVVGTIDLSIPDLGHLYGEGSSFNDVVSCYNAELYDCQLNAAITCTQLTAYETFIQGDVTADFVNLTGCGVTSIITAANTAIFDDCDISQSVTATTITITKARGLGFDSSLTLTATTLNIDAASYAIAILAGANLVITNLNIIGSAPEYMEWGCSQLSALAAGPIMTPWSKEVVTGAADTNKWIAASQKGRIKRLYAKMRIAHTEDITFTISLNFAPTAATITILAGQTENDVDVDLAVAEGNFITASAVAADEAAAAFSMDVTAEFFPAPIP